MSPSTQKTHPLAAHEAERALADRLLPRLAARNFTAEYAPTPEAALQAALARIPQGAEVMTGSSRTLEELGLVAALSKGPYRYLRDGLQKEPDEARRHRLRKEAVLADWFVGSVPAITEDGMLVAVDGSGSRITGYAFGGTRVLIIASLHKVVPTLEAAFARIRDDVFPKEDARMKGLGLPGSTLGKWLLYEREPVKGRVHVILVGGKPLGF